MERWIDKKKPGVVVLPDRSLGFGAGFLARDPDGHALVLDEDEFEEKRVSVYSAEDSAQAKVAVEQLLEMATRRAHPFNEKVMGDE